MTEKVKLSDFDILGIITLKDVQGIEEFVTPIIIDGKCEGYLSRSKEYYNVKSMTQLALEREKLKNQIKDKQKSKRNFVIVENMLNCSAKTYFKKFQDYILNSKNERLGDQLKQAEKCVMDDVRNLLVILQDKGTLEISDNILPPGNENSEKRAIEMDNKAILYIFSQALKLKLPPEDVEILTPGYGSIYIGPFLKAMYGYNYTNTLKSKYIEKTRKASEESKIRDLTSSNRIFGKGKKVILIDDNIGTGATMEELKKSLLAENIETYISGAVQYNWRNYYKIAIGEKTDIERFDIDKYDILTPFNYAGHKLYEHAIDMLHSSGAEYLEYLKMKSYRCPNYCDAKGAIYRGIWTSRGVGLDIIDPEYEVPEHRIYGFESANIIEKYKDGPITVTNPIAKKIIESIVGIVDRTERKQKTRLD